MSLDEMPLGGNPAQRLWPSLAGINVVDANRLQRNARTDFRPTPSAPTADHSRSEPLEPYRAYKPRPFHRAEREQVTILFGGLNWRTERAMQGSMENLGYKVRVLPQPTRADLLAGRELADIGQCCPTSFTTGCLANFLRAESGRIGREQVEKRYVYLTAGTCGACRFGQYHSSYELALRNIGLDRFRMFVMNASDLTQGAVDGGGLEFGMPFTLGLLWSLILTDLIRDMEFRIRPYEVHAGETDRVGRESIEYLYDVFRHRPHHGKKWGPLAWHLVTGYFSNAMGEIKQRFDQIEVDRLRVKPVVKMTGEFFLKLVENEANYNMHKWLEDEGAEVYPSMASMIIDYFWRFDQQNADDRIGLRHGARRDRLRLQLCRQILKQTYRKMRKALGDVPHAMIEQDDLRRLAAPYYHGDMNGGEGYMLVGQAVWAHLNAKAHMTCELSPYACMPNTMSVGAMAAVLGRYPELLYAPIEIKGDAEVHAYSRCQMILTEAKKRAQDEFFGVLERTGMSEDRLRQEVAARPELSRATFQLPHYGVAGTAANLALHVAAGRS